VTVAYVILWEFEPVQGREADFRKAYGPEGVWARFFQRGSGYLGTALFTDPEHPGRYVTEDRWLTRKYFDQFRVQYADAYRDLDRECEPLTKREKLIGGFETD